jgi:hypothetical protein
MLDATRKKYTTLALVGLAFAPLAATADSGFYIGGSLGGATLEAEFDPNDIPVPDLPSSIDEDDTAYKIFAGYRFDLPVIDLGVEAGYVNFGEPEVDILGEELVLDPTGVNLWGVASLDAGIIDVFAKVGYIMWDIEADFLGESISDDGTDIGYGLGVSFGLGPVEIRGEYELYDIEDADVSMLSLGIVFRFD